MNLTLLRQLYPILVVRNRSDVTKQIDIGMGDSIQVNPNGEARLATASLTQLPSHSEFKYVSPTFPALIRAGIIETAV